MSTSAPSTMRRDIASAYIATAARIGSWVVITGVVYRTLGAEALAMLALVRGTLGILTYTSLGLGPAMVRSLATAAKRELSPVAVLPVTDSGDVVSSTGLMKLEYASVPQPSADQDFANIFRTGERLALLLALPALLLGCIYGLSFNSIHDVPRAVLDDTTGLAVFFASGVILRLISDTSSSVLQVRGYISLDNVYVAGADLLWCTLTALFILKQDPAWPGIGLAGLAFCIANVMLLLSRAASARFILRGATVVRSTFVWAKAVELSRFGGGVVLSQLADFLYAPIAFIIINELIDAVALADYVPASQIDSGLLMLVTAIAAVLFPAAALADARGDHVALKRLYLRGTLISAAMLTVAGMVVWIISPWLFQIWMNDPMETTQKILPFVLIHTIIGGSGAVGRSILLGMGKVRPFTISVLIAGVANVILSYVFVRYFEMDLYGIVLGTIIVVVARAGIWTPWYVMKSLGVKGQRSGVSNGEIADP